MIRCKVIENAAGHLNVIFEAVKDHVTAGDSMLYLQTESDRAAFGVACGAIKASKNWDGQSSTLPDKWWEIEWDDIVLCPEEYKEQADTVVE